MLGLDSAGKTTALYRLKLDQYLNAVTTIGFNCEKVFIFSKFGTFCPFGHCLIRIWISFDHNLQVRGALGKAKGAQFLVWDVGGQEKLRPLWRSYTRYYNILSSRMSSTCKTLFDRGEMNLQWVTHVSLYSEYAKIRVFNTQTIIDFIHHQPLGLIQA